MTNCPKCNQKLVYDHYIDGDKCLFCRYYKKKSESHDIYDDNQLNPKKNPCQETNNTNYYYGEANFED